MPILKEEDLSDILFQQDGAEHLFIFTLQWRTSDRKFHRKGSTEAALTWPPRFPDLTPLDFF
jgi:hypothetical protein